jgi:hypothetical protein
MDLLQGFTEQMAQNVQVAQALRAAAQQQQEHNDEMRLRDAELDLRSREFANQQGQQGFKNLMDALNAGGQPVSDSGTVAKNTDVPRFQMDQGGALTRVGSGTNETADAGRTVNVGGRQIYIPTQEETAAMGLRDKMRETEAVNQANSWSLPDALSNAWEDRLGLKAGTLKGMQVPKSAVPNLLTQFAKPEPAEKAQPKLTPHFTTDDEGNVSAFVFDADKGQVKRAGYFAGAGAKKKDPDKQKPPSAAELRIITEKKASRLADAEGAYQQDAQIYGANSPELLNTLHKAKQDAQNEYEQSLAALGLGVQHYEYPKQQTAAPQKQAPNQKGASASKSASLAQVRQYAQKKGVSESAAIREFKQSGYSIAGQQ